MSDAPIFIVGTERSGSNLLRLILNAHSRIAIPHPPHIMRYFAPIEAGYGDLQEPQSFARLVDDILRLVRLHIYPWEIPIDRERLLVEATPHNTFGVFVALSEQFLAHSGKARWGCKSTFFIDHAQVILERFADARLIWLVRDPRDVAVSSRQSVFSPCHPFLTARLWADQQRTGLDLRERLPAHSLLLVRYEDLLADAHAVIKRICDFVNEPFEESLLQFFATDEAQKSGSLSASWRNTARPILSANAGRYRDELTHSELEVVEAVTGELMQELGYHRDTNADPATAEPSALRRVRYHLLDRWWRLGVEMQSLRRDRNHWRRWARDLYVAYLAAVRR